MNDGALTTETLYAWIAKDLDGCEGVIAIPTEQGILPLVVTDKRIALKMEPLAVEAARARNHFASLVIFKRDRTIKLIG